jgi:hypothetical protein
VSAALHVLERARDLGVEVEALGNRLKLRALRKPPADLLAELSALKPELLVLLKRKAAAASDSRPRTDDGAPAVGDIDVMFKFEERAALVEDGTGAPREWCEGFARLDVATPPAGFDERRWRTLLEDGGVFLNRWGAEAARRGWSAEDVFGVHPVAPGARYDTAGLVVLIDGGEVTAMSEKSASIRTRSSGATLIYLRTPRDGSVALWEMASIVVSTGGGLV